MTHLDALIPASGRRQSVVVTVRPPLRAPGGTPTVTIEMSEGACLVATLKQALRDLLQTSATIFIAIDGELADDAALLIPTNRVVAFLAIAGG